MPMYCNNFELEESRDEFLLRAEPPEAFALYPNSNPGPPGPPGPGVPAGGTAGQLLVKASATDYDTEWSDPPELDAEHVTYDESEAYSDGTIGKAVSDLNSAISTKADVIIDSVGPAAIASFPDGADNMPIREIAATIEPVQDLHGYDNPWPPGGGKNKVPLTVTGIKSANSTRTWDANNSTTINNVVFTILTDENGVVTGIKANGTASSNATLYVFGNTTLSYGGYILNGCVADGGSSKWFIEYYDNTTGTSYRNYGSDDLTLSSDTNGHECRLVVSVRNGAQADNIVFKPMIRASTETDATFAPYSNVCAITGWTGANGKHANGNLLNSSIIEQGGINSSGADAPSNTRIRTGAITLKAGSYTINSADAYQSVFYVYNLDGNFLSGESDTTWRTNPYTYTIAKDRKVRFTWRVNNTNPNIAPSDIHEARLSVGSTSLPYQTYVEPTAIPISWQTAAGTVYFGKLTISEDGSVTLTATYGIATENTFTTFSTKTNNRNTGYVQVADCGSKMNGNAITNMLPVDNAMAWNVEYPVAQVGTSVNGRLRVYGTFNSLSAFQTEFEGLQFVYELETPVTYTLDSIDQLFTKLGTNNIWFDCGQTSAKYPADTKLYIDKKLSALAAQIVNS